MKQHRHISLGRTELKASQSYQILSHLVVPRPIALVSTVDNEGNLNLAPFSFFMVGGSNPPSVAISPATRSERGGEKSLSSKKDTLSNILQTEEFVIHGVDTSTVDAANLASVEVPHDVSEWDTAGFTQMGSMMVKPPRIQECLWALECKLHQWVRHGNGPGAANYLIGEVVVFHLSEELLQMKGDNLNLNAWDWVGRLEGQGYVKSDPAARFDLTRPTA